MCRLVPLALFAFTLPAAGMANPLETAGQGKAQSFHMPRPSADYTSLMGWRVERAEIGPNAHFGFGMFGLKSEKTHLQPVTVREIIAPKQRRAAVGFSVKF